MAQHYDVAVVGGEVTSLLASLMWARGGRRVLLVEHDPAGTADCSPLWPVGDVSVIARMHDDLAISQPMDVRAGPKQGLQVILPHHRLDFTGGRAALAQELKRAFPKLSAPIDDFLQRLSQHDRALSHFVADAPYLPPESVKERLHLWRNGRHVQRFRAPADALALDGLFGDIPRGHPIRWLFEGTQQLVGDTAVATDTLMATVHRMAQTFLGSAPPAVDRTALLAMLWAAAERAGVSIRRGALVREMALSGKRATHLSVVGDRSTYRADYYLHSAQGPLSKLLPPAQDPQGLAKEQTPVAVAGGWVRWQWQVDARLVPLGLAAQAVVLDGRREARGHARRSDAPFVLQRTKGTQEGAITLTVTLPWQRLAGDTHDGANDLGALWAQVLPRLRRIIPQLPPSANPPGTHLAAARYAPSPNSPWGVAGRSRKTGLHNVVYCGRDVVPGLGLEGEYLAALGAVRLLNARARWT